jgi:hypothetical protein
MDEGDNPNPIHTKQRINIMAAQTWTCTLSHGLGNNYTIEVTATSQSHARKVAECQSGDKCIRATR